MECKGLVDLIIYDMNKTIIRRYFYLTVSLLTFLSCQKKDECNIRYTITYPKSENSVTLSDFCDDCKYVLLDSALLLGRINDISVTNNSFILKDYYEGILVYDSSGKFINKLGSFGKGPGEYLKYHTVFTNNVNDSIVYILNAGRQILKYSLSGNFLGSFNIKDSLKFYNIYTINNRTLLLTASISNGSRKYNWCVIDTSGNYIYKKNNYINFKATKYSGPSPLTITYKFKNSTFFYDQYNDTLFKIGINTYNPHIIINLENKRLTPSISEKETPRYKTQKRFIIPQLFFETNRHVFFCYYEDMKEKYTLLNKHTKKYSFIKSTIYRGLATARMRMTNDIDGGIPIGCNFKVVSIKGQSYMLIWAYADELKKHVASAAFKNSTPKYPEKKKELVKLANSLKEDDNPVLMLVKLKDEGFD